MIRESTFGLGGNSDNTNEITEKISRIVIVVKAHIIKNNLVFLNSKYVTNATMLKNKPNNVDEIWIEM